MSCAEKDSRASSSTATISFHKINYSIKTNRASNDRKMFPSISPICCQRNSKQILFDVSGQFFNGLNAILGPSGCGKSSLIDMLADRKDLYESSGAIFVNGSPRSSLFRYQAGYVVQDDICSGALTVKENICFSLLLRTTTELTCSEQLERVSMTIKQLGLESCADVRVGTEFIRGVSGGERKRTCIGMELVLSPQILFLDEPTTGLDASTAMNIIACLKNLSQEGRTIIFSIHQPRYSIFKMFDTIMLMSKGRCIYHGSNETVVSHFNSYGYQNDILDNPTDFLLDVLIDIGHKPDLLQRMSQHYIARHTNQSLENQIIETSINQRRANTKSFIPTKREMFYLSQRTIRNAIRSPNVTFAQTIVSIFLGLLIGLVFFDMKKTTDPGIQNRLGAIFFIVISQIFINVTALEALLKERSLFIHEFSSGYYRILSYFTSKLLCDTIPMRVVPSVFFSIITYFMMGFSRTISQFLIYLLTIFSASLFGSALCFLASASVSVFPLALIFVILICIVMVLFSGFLLDTRSILNWLSWIKWLSVGRYASNILTINELKGNHFCLPNNTMICPTTGEQVLDRLGIDHDHAWDLWKNFVAIISMTTILFILAYIQMIRMKKTK